MKYCKKCLQVDTRPNTFFNKHGVCPACVYFYSTLEINYSSRIKKLNKILEKIRHNKKNQNFDCIIGVSGGKDSTRQALWVRDKLKLKPLLVCLSYPPDQVTLVGVKNISNLINLGFDVEIVSLGPKTWKKLLLESFIKNCNWAKPSEQALFSSLPLAASRHNIELIFLGENPGYQLGDMKTIGKNGYDGNNIFNMNTLGGGSTSWMKKIVNSENKLYHYSHHTKVKKNKFNIIYLGYFWSNWSLKKNGTIASINGLKLRQDNFKNTQDLKGISALDEDFVIINQMIKYYKYGFGRVSDYVNEDIRNKIIDREKGIKILKKYDGNCSEKYINYFCDYLKINQKFFWKIVNKFTNKKLFKIQKQGRPIPKFEVGIGLNEI